MSDKSKLLGNLDQMQGTYGEAPPIVEEETYPWVLQDTGRLSIKASDVATRWRVVNQYRQIELVVRTDESGGHIGGQGELYDGLIATLYEESDTGRRVVAIRGIRDV